MELGGEYIRRIERRGLSLSSDETRTVRPKVKGTEWRAQCGQKLKEQSDVYSAGQKLKEQSDVYSAGQKLKEQSDVYSAAKS